MRDRARSLRVEATPFEQSFWQRVRAGRLGGFKFRRQQVIGGYIVDFVCQAAGLVVELDGSQHHDAGEYDQERDAWLRAQGYRVLRVWNSEWAANPEGVLEAVWGMLHEGVGIQGSPHPRPLSSDGRGLVSRAKGTCDHGTSPSNTLDAVESISPGYFDRGLTVSVPVRVEFRPFLNTRNTVASIRTALETRTSGASLGLYTWRRREPQHRRAPVQEPGSRCG
ncbi:MAG: endonuclease domain-containing protein [Deltaproteobacteria bacterium]|nr:endonuclease domain-containing protein [Deltaproteobacteria bacterium]